MSTWSSLWKDDWSSVRPFFHRFRKPTDIQRKAIPTIRAGEDSVVVAPTASGKTEAILPPLLARNRDHLNPQGGPLILYVAPTRALVSDLVQRIRKPLDRMGGEVRERTSDRRNWHDGDACSVLVTTPESLDSITMRSSSSLRSVKGIIVDEIHLLEGGPRGLQLRMVLERLEQTLDDNLQRVISSATMPDLEVLADRWGRDTSIITSSEPHELEVHLLRSDWDDKWFHFVQDFIRNKEARKVLAFGNSRKKVEGFSSSIQQGYWTNSSWTVRTHHSSLSQKERQRTEDEFKSQEDILVSATSTLEVGIDIGDVDLVVLLDPPYTLNSFLQRLGRGCRRKEHREVLAVADSPRDAQLFHALTEAARRGKSDGGITPPLLAVAIQQIASTIQQKANETEQGKEVFLTPSTIQHILHPSVKFDERIEEFVEQSIDAACSMGLIKREEAWDGDQRFQILKPGSKLESFVDSRLFHIAFSPSGEETEVVDAQSRETIGTVMMMNPEPGSLLQLAGRSWRIVNVKSGRVLVQSQPSGGATPPGYISTSGHASRELAHVMADHVWTDWKEGQGAFYFDEDEDEWVYAHFLGFKCAILLTSYLKENGFQAKDPTPFSFRCNERWHEELGKPRTLALKNLVSENPEIATRTHSMGRLYKKIHDEYGTAQAKLVFDWERITRDIREVSFREVEQQEIDWGYDTREIIEGL